MPKKDEVLEKCFSKARVIWLSKSTVAPFTGAWIETGINSTLPPTDGASHPSRAH